MTEMQTKTEESTYLSNATLPVYRNSVPVVVTLVPVLGTDPADGMEKRGILAVRRSIPPAVGQLAFPGGYLEYEEWQGAGLRELSEEAGISLEPGTELIPRHILSVEQGRKLLIFAETPTMHEAELPPFIPNSECSERVIIYSPCRLAFPAHTEMLERFFSRQAP